ncbi:hypothetical protein CROQUDRAFT_707489 [Cronartium quercuum f. sp. fusiforme G11]|uniref:fructose-bisphosphatase n=1 Tax=Cronartium quercuum f. sp. fusiforme G11 TaxID=708437 RepID=A0A9P6N7W9_9BASI|nr:hypothetical protein CROQUDRAFT_707489 [Cronartium quercuum f. sp. fusiforme G11]
MYKEKKKKLDVLSEQIMINSLRASGKIALMLSEEDIKYLSKLIHEDLSISYMDVGVDIGTIFGIYCVTNGETPSLEHILKPGKEMVAAGYCMYGSSTNLVISTGNSVNGYTLDNDVMYGFFLSSLL